MSIDIIQTQIPKLHIKAPSEMFDSVPNAPLRVTTCPLGIIHLVDTQHFQKNSHFLPPNMPTYM